MLQKTICKLGIKLQNIYFQEVKGERKEKENAISTTWLA